MQGGRRGVDRRPHGDYPGIDRAIVIGQMLGECEKKNLRSSKGAKAGDDLILTKGIAIEAVSVIARTKRGELEKAFPKAFVERCAGFMKIPNQHCKRR